jgi:hypothetical protein
MFSGDKSLDAGADVWPLCTWRVRITMRPPDTGSRVFRVGPVGYLVAFAEVRVVLTTER